jgi:hypothetical protein
MEKYREVELQELLTDNGYVVAIEGDDDLYDDDLAEWLKTYCKNYKLLNHIYKEPKKLLDLKDINIDVFIFQTTGLNPQLPQLIDLYIEKVGNYPKHFITVFRDGEEHFWKIFQQMDSYNVYHYKEIDGDKLYMIRQDHSCKMI